MGVLFNKCCFCIDLRSGSLLVGYINLIMEIILLVLCLVLMLLGGAITAVGKGEDEQAIGIAILIVIGVLAVLIALFFAFTIVLLVGLHQSRRGHIKAYLIFTTIFLVLVFIGWFGNFITKDINVFHTVLEMLGILISIYFLLVIKSYYSFLGEQNGGPAAYMTA